MDGSDEAEVTVRQRIMAALERGPVSTKEVAKVLGIKEKEVLGHLPHVLRSVSPQKKIEVSAAVCLGCGFVFRKRGRISTPGKCPLCRSQRIEPPSFRIVKVR